MCIGPVEYNIEKMEDIDICRLYGDNFDCHRGRGVAGLLLQRRQGSQDISFNWGNLLQLKIFLARKSLMLHLKKKVSDINSDILYLGLEIVLKKKITNNYNEHIDCGRVLYDFPK